ncbi:MAG: tetratricopeptide repeat protein, partial [Herbaspirillum sp.]
YLAQPEAHLALARAAFEAGDGTRATKEAQIATHAQPNSELAILTLAQLAPDKAAASIALTNFLDKHPKAREVRIAYARLLVEEKQYQSARAQFATLLKSDPHDLTTLFALGTLSAELDDYPGAEQYLSSYIDTLAAQPDPARDPTQALLMLAQIAQDRNDIPRALKWLGQVEPGPAYVGAQIKRAQLVARQGNIEHAQKMLTEISTDGEREETQVILARGQILRDAGRVQQAREVLQHALQKTPNNVDLLYDYAMLAEQQNDLGTMETALRKIIQIAPKNQHAYNALGYALADHNVRLPEALELITQALQMAPQDPFILDSMGWVQYRMGQLQQAQDYLQRAYDAQPDTEIGVHLGEVLWVSGRHEAALKLWRTVRDKDPKSKVLESTLTRLQVAL